MDTFTEAMRKTVRFISYHNVMRTTIDLNNNWRGGKNRYRFGRRWHYLQKIDASGIADKIGSWWYDYPNDLDENPDDTGTGELLFIGKGRSQLELTSRAATTMAITPEGNQPGI